MADYFSFEDVMGELEISEEDLKRMVSEGELRAFRDENKMKFKREDVEDLKKGRITEPTIILPSTPGGGTDETVLNLDIGEETSALIDSTQSDDGGADLNFDDADLTIAADEDLEIGIESDETFIEEEVDTGLTTEPLQLADEADETVEAVAVEDEGIETETVNVGSRPTRSSRRMPTAMSVGAEEEIEAQRPHWVWTSLMAASFLFAAFTGIFFYDMTRLESGAADQPLNVTAGIADFVLDKFWTDQEWKKFHETEYPENGQKAPPINPDITHHGYELPNYYNGPSYHLPDELQRTKK